MACNNCYNGCSETVSDKCVKYTGPDVPELGIETGDSLATVEAAIFQYLVPALDGTGIKPDINQDDICDLVLQYLPSCTICTGFTLNEILSAVILAICNLDNQISQTNDRIDTIEADYNVNCLEGVTGNAGTHAVLQAVIDKVCELGFSLNQVILNLATNYVTIANINDYIQAYIDDQASTNLMSSRMVPYSATPYFGPLTPFDLTGAGTGDYLRIFLCNGQNGTPDLRGRGVVGTTNMGSTPFNPIVDPAIAGNPTYALNTTAGANQVTLGPTQIPPHVHSATSVVTDAGHAHFLSAVSGQTGKPVLSPTNYMASIANYGNDGNYVLGGVTTPLPTVGLTSKTPTGITVATTVDASGGGLPHANIQPVHAAHYIIYIP